MDNRDVYIRNASAVILKMGFQQGSSREKHKTSRDRLNKRRKKYQMPTGSR